MPTTDVVRLEDLDQYIGQTLKKVNDGVALACAAGVQAELPETIDFTAVVIAPAGWQALEMIDTDEQSGTDTSTAEEKSVVKESGTTTERQTGHQTEAQSGTTVVAQSGSEQRISKGEEHHTQNTDEVTDTYEA